MTHPGDRVGENPVYVHGDRLRDNVPDVDLEDPASLECFYGNFGFFEIWRKVVLSNCKEIVRATSTEKLTEARLDDLARLHPNYLDFITTHLMGRTLREQNVLQSLTAAGR